MPLQRSLDGGCSVSDVPTEDGDRETFYAVRMAEYADMAKELFEKQAALNALPEAVKSITRGEARKINIWF